MQTNMLRFWRADRAIYGLMLVAVLTTLSMTGFPFSTHKRDHELGNHRLPRLASLIRPCNEALDGL
jgi:hypothetical protein